MSQANMLTTIPAESIKTNAVATMDTEAGFELLQRQARLFANSSLVPPQYRVGGIVKEGGENIKISLERATANCTIALSMAQRMNLDPMVILQNMFIINGRPAFGATFMIGLFNKTGKFSPLTYTYVGEQNKDTYGCYASCVRLSDNREIVGPTVTIMMAKREGWFAKTGSKWNSMPDLMLRYRAAAFLIRTTSPECCLGLLTQEEAIDIALEDNKRTYYAPPAQVRPAPQSRPFRPAQVQQSRPTPVPQEIPQAPQAAPAPQAATTQATPAPQSAPAQPTPQPQPQPTPQPAPTEPPAEEIPIEAIADAAAPASLNPPTEETNIVEAIETQAEMVQCPQTGGEVSEDNCRFCAQKSSCPSW